MHVLEIQPYTTFEKKLAEDRLSKKESWEGMVNDIEKLQIIKKIVVDAFEEIKNADQIPARMKYFVKEQYDQLSKEAEKPIFENEELGHFFTFANILSDKLINHFNNKEIPDYAATYSICISLELLTRKIKEKLENNINLNELGLFLIGGLYGLKEKIRTTDWKQGWK